MVACLESGQQEPLNDTKTPDPPTNLKKVQQQEKAIVAIILSDRNRELCSKVSVAQDGEKMESVKCHLKNGGTITYSLIAETSLTIETKEGEVIADDQTDGTVDFGLDPQGERKYFREFRLQYVEGEKHRQHWQDRLEQFLDELESEIVHTSKRAPNAKFEALLLLYCFILRGCATWIYYSYTI